jgi:hypothetical protein
MNARKALPFKRLGLVAWDGVEPPTRGFSAQAKTATKKDDDAK